MSNIQPPQNTTSIQRGFQTSAPPKPVTVPKYADNPTRADPIKFNQRPNRVTFMWAQLYRQARRAVKEKKGSFLSDNHNTKRNEH